MRFLPTLPLALVLVAASVLSASAQQAAQAPRAPRPVRGGEDWVQLFNGKDTTGWNNVGQEKWTIEPGGVLHGVAVTKGYGYLQTDKSYKDFVLALQFKCEGDGNSGLFFHTGFKPGTADVSQGLQFEIDCGMMKHTGGLYGDGRNWIVWPAPENEAVVRRGEWNEYVLEVRGNRYISRLNGVMMVDFTDPQPKSFDGTLALQLHSGGTGDMKFREIWVRDLTQR